MIKRILPLVVVFALLIPLLVFPASAAEFDYDIMTSIDQIRSWAILDYRDYVQRRDVDGDYDVLKLYDDPDYYGWYLMKGSSSVEKVFGTAEYTPDLSLLNESIVRETRIMFRPYGQSLFSLANIPHQSELTIDTKFLVCEPFPTEIKPYLDLRLTLTYFNSECRKVSSSVQSLNKYFDEETDWTTYTGSFVFDIPDNACYFLIDVKSSLDVVADYIDLNTEMEVDHFSMGLNILTSYRDQEVMGDISDSLDDANDKLGDVSNKLDENNNMMDEIINGEVEPERPEGSDSIDDLGKLEEELLDNVGDGMSDYEVFIDDSVGIIQGHLSAFALMSAIFDSFVGVGWLRGLLIISLSLGIFGYLVNFSFRSAGDSASKSSSKAGKSQLSLPSAEKGLRKV